MNQRITGKSLAGVILVGFALLLSFRTLTELPQIGYNLGYLSVGGLSTLNSLAFLSDLISNNVFFFGAIALLVTIFVSKNKKTVRLIALIVGIVGPGLSMIANILWMAQGSPFSQAFFGFDLNTPGQLRVLATFPALAGLILILLSHKAPAAANVSAAPTQNRFDPETGLPLAGAQAPQPVANGGAESSLPLVALILAFFVPLGAVIVGHIAMNQMNQGLISSQNRGMAKAGLVLGYVFMGLSVLFGVIFGIAYFALLSNSYY